MDEELTADEEPTVQRISRRKALKRIGVAGAAMAWSAPLVSSLRTPAFAQAGSPRCGETCTTCYTSGTSSVCGTDVGGDCLCSVTTEGDCFCATNLFTDELTCADSNDCSGGRRCLNIFNYGCAGNACLDPCGGTARAATTARTAGSRPGDPA